MMSVLSPIVALMLTMLVGGGIFMLMGYDGAGVIVEIFIRPLIEVDRWQDLAVKATPLILIALGLSIGFQANVWNIGAEGQYIAGAMAATGVALATWEMSGWWILPAMGLAGIVGGLLYAGIPALLRVRFHVNEILASLMLTYVAVQGLYYLVRGPWKDPDGFNFPETRLFSDSQAIPLIDGTLMHWGMVLVPVVMLLVWLMMSHTLIGFQLRVYGAAPRAARYGGFSENRLIVLALLCSGGLAGLAGMLEVAGGFGQLTPQFPSSYGFTAIIVAFLGRLHPFGIMVAGLALAITYVGGEGAQIRFGLPHAAVAVIQAMMLFFLLAADAALGMVVRLGRRWLPLRS